MANKELFYTRYNDGGEEEAIATRFYTDGTYRCDHWDSERNSLMMDDYWSWRINDGKLFFMHNKDTSTGSSWYEWTSEDAEMLAAIVECELATHNMIEGITSEL